MYSLCLLLLISTLFVFAINGEDVEITSENCTDWDRDEYLDYKNRVYLQWKTVGDNLIMQVTGQTKGWLGIGFSYSESMINSDIVIGWVKNGKGYLQDRHGLSANELPPIDSEKNYQLLRASENETATNFCFTRKLSTCDEDDYEITNDTVRIIWAMHQEDPIDTNETSTKYHGTSNRGASHQNILRRSLPRPDMTDVKTFDILATKVPVPDDQDTYYWCQYFQLPNLTEKHHIIGFEPVMQEGNEEYVHHIEIYECMGDNINELIETEMKNSAFSNGVPCASHNSPYSSFHCQKEVMIWAPGKKGQYFPPEAGYPLGNDEFRYYFGSFHYNNPSKISGIVDSSGIRILYTKNLRKYDAGLTLLGYSMHQPYLVIPPGQDTWISVAHCSPQCLETTAKGQEIYIYGLQYHMHLTGRKLKLRHFRDGIELPPIGDNKNFDFYYQQSQIFYDTVKVLPTDTITIECYFNTTDRKNVTLGNIGTNDEMCMLYIYYYPRIALDNCMSHLQPSIIHKLVGVEELWPNPTGYYKNDETIKEPESLRNESLRSYLQQYQFSPEQIKELQKHELNSPKTINCITNGNIFQPKDVKTVNYPSFVPFVEPKKVCDASK